MSGQFCKGCSTFKPLSEFVKDRWRKSGYTYRCKTCRNAHQKEYFKKKPEIRKKVNQSKKEYRKTYYEDPARKRRYRDLSYRRTFGITVEDYERILASQNGRCAICGTDDPKVTRRKNGYIQHFHIDHCHKTNKVRGLLCAHCNRGLGCFKDRPEFLEAAINYLRKNS